jgi:hypothetical protein
MFWLTTLLKNISEHTKTSIDELNGLKYTNKT